MILLILLMGRCQLRASGVGVPSERWPNIGRGSVSNTVTRCMLQVVPV